MSDVFDQAIDRVLRRKNREVYELLQRSGLYDNVATAIRGRKVLVRGRWLTDFASCNYPLVPRDKDVLRATPTVANTWDEVEQLITAVGRVHRTLTAQ